MSWIPEVTEIAISVEERVCEWAGSPDPEKRLVIGGPEEFVSVPKRSVESFLGRPLPRKYQVRYVLDPEGPYLVGLDAGWVVIRSGEGLILAGCFLPREWVGQRVRREDL